MLNYLDIETTGLDSEKDKVITIQFARIDFNTGIGWIGKGLSPVYWGKGYMSEAMDMYLDYNTGTSNAINAGIGITFR